MKLKSGIIIALLVLLANGLMACAPAAGAELEATPISLTPSAEVVSAEAFVVPVKQADLAFEVSGRVVHLPVQEGEQIQSGQLLAKLDDTTYQAALAQAEAALAQAQAALAQTRAPATADQIAQAQAALAKAEALLAEQVAGPTKEQIAEARAHIASAQAGLNQVLAGTRQEELQAASAKLLQAEADVRLAQADYDKFVYGDPKVAEPFGVALQKATLTYEAAKADYDKLVNGATNEDIAVARARVAEAEAALATVLAGSTPEQIAQAQAEVASAQAALAELEAGATSETIAVAEAEVASARVGVQAAQAELAKTALVAPFGGTVSALNIDEGEMVQAGTAAVSLGDTSRWQIETDDLTEIDVVHVEAGARVQISVDALPGEEFTGKVVRITPKSETKAGDVTYTVLIDLTEGQTERLRWGMTTFVDIEIGPEL